MSKYIWLMVLLMLGCAGRQFRVHESTEAEIRQHLSGNFNQIAAIEQSWRANLEDRRLGQIPFRLDLNWSADSVLLIIRSPFGGELARLRGRPGGFGAATGSKLPSWLKRAAKAIELPEVEAGLDRWFGKDDGPYKVELSDPALAPLLNLAAPQLPGDWLKNGLIDRESLGPWLWGAWVPDDEATWNADSLNFEHGRQNWQLDPETGFCAKVNSQGWQVELSDYRKRNGVRLPGKMRFRSDDGDRRLTLVSRSLKVRKEHD